MRCGIQLPVMVIALLAAIALVTVPPAAHAELGWLAVASSPSRAALDWYTGASRQSTESGALQQCAALQNADDCRILASGPNCVAVVWDAHQPLNRPHAVAADTSAAALTAAVAAAGAFANDPTVRCTYMSYGSPPDSPPSGTHRRQLL